MTDDARTCRLVLAKYKAIAPAAKIAVTMRANVRAVGIVALVFDACVICTNDLLLRGCGRSDTLSVRRRRRRASDSGLVGGSLWLIFAASPSTSGGGPIEFGGRLE